MQSLWLITQYVRFAFNWKNRSLLECDRKTPTDWSLCSFSALYHSVAQRQLHNKQTGIYLCLIKPKKKYQIDSHSSVWWPQTLKIKWLSGQKNIHTWLDTVLNTVWMLTPRHIKYYIMNLIWCKKYCPSSYHYTKVPGKLFHCTPIRELREYFHLFMSIRQSIKLDLAILTQASLVFLAKTRLD